MELRFETCLTNHAVYRTPFMREIQCENVCLHAGFVRTAEEGKTCECVVFYVQSSSLCLLLTLPCVWTIMDSRSSVGERARRILLEKPYGTVRQRAGGSLEGCVGEVVADFKEEDDGFSENLPVQPVSAIPQTE